MAWSLLAAGLCTLIPGTGSTHLGLTALFIYLFAAFYSPGEGPVPFTYSAEVFPLSHREMGLGFAVSVCLGFAAVLTISFPAILASLGVLGAFCLYAGFNIVAFVMIFLWVPETKQRTLEELDYGESRAHFWLGAFSITNVGHSICRPYPYLYAVPNLHLAALVVQALRLVAKERRADALVPL